MQRPPRNIGLYLKTLKDGSKRYESRLWNPHLGRIGKKKSWKETDLEKVLQLHFKLKNAYADSNYELITTIKKEKPQPYLILDCAALFEKYLNDDPHIVLSHKAKNLSKHYVRDTVRYVKEFLNCLKNSAYKLSETHINAVDDRAVAIFYEYLQERFANGEIGPVTWNHTIKACDYWIKTLIREFDYQIKYEITNPFDGVKFKKKVDDPQYLEFHELREFLEVITPENGMSTKGSKNEKVSYYRPWLRKYFLISAFIGGRPIETAQATWLDVIEDHIWLRTNKGGGGISKIYIHPELAELLSPMHAKASEEDFILVPEWENRKSLITFCSKAFIHYLRQTSIRKKVSFYNLRHTYINTLYHVIGEEALTVHHSKEVAIQHYLSKKKRVDMQEGKVLFQGFFKEYY